MIHREGRREAGPSFVSRFSSLSAARHIIRPSSIRGQARDRWKPLRKSSPHSNGMNSALHLNEMISFLTCNRSARSASLPPLSLRWSAGIRKRMPGADPSTCGYARVLCVTRPRPNCAAVARVVAGRYENRENWSRAVSGGFSGEKKNFPAVKTGRHSRPATHDVRLPIDFLNRVGGPSPRSKS